MLQALIVPLVLLANGLAAGVLMGTQLGGFPLLAALPPDRYVHAHAFFATRYDPFMPACLIGTLGGDMLLTAFPPGGAGRLPYLLAAAFAAGTVTISLTKNVPINKWIQTVDPQRLPGNFAELDPRRRWGFWNRTRSILAIAALVANCVGVGLAS